MDGIFGGGGGSGGAVILSNYLRQSLIYDQYERTIREQDEALRSRVEKVRNERSTITTYPTTTTMTVTAKAMAVVMAMGPAPVLGRAAVRRRHRFRKQPSMQRPNAIGPQGRRDRLVCNAWPGPEVHVDGCRVDHGMVGRDEHQAQRQAPLRLGQ